MKLYQCTRVYCIAYCPRSDLNSKRQLYGGWNLNSITFIEIHGVTYGLHNNLVHLESASITGCIRKLRTHFHILLTRFRLEQDFYSLLDQDFDHGKSS